MAAEGGRRRTTATTASSGIAELAINNTRRQRRRRGRYHSRFEEDSCGDDDEEGKHKHVCGVVYRGYMRGQSVIVGGGGARSHANRVGLRRSASFHAAELFEDLAGMGSTLLILLLLYL